MLRWGGETLVSAVRQVDDGAYPPLSSMNLADVFTVVLSVGGLLTVFVGWWLAVAGLFPRLVERCADQLGTGPWRCFGVGVACAVPLIFTLIGFGKVSTNPAAKLLSGALVILVLLLALAGTAGLALRIGRGMATAADGDENWRCVRRGGIVLAITYGTIVVLPLTLLAGLGAIVRSRSGGGEKPGVGST